MASNLDLGMGLIQGLQQGLNSYLSADQRTKERAMEQQRLDNEISMNKKQYGAQLAEHGLIDNGDGTYGQDPQWEARQIRLERAKNDNPINRLAKSLTPGEKSADEAFGKTYEDYVGAGGRSTVDQQLGLLESAAKDLESGKVKTGGLTTRLPFLSSDVSQDTLNPDLAATRDKVRSAVQGTVKQLFPGAISDYESKSVFERAFNPRLSNEENARRIRAAIDQLKSKANEMDSSSNYFGQAGTLKGYLPSKGLIGASSAPNGSAKPPGTNRTQSSGSGLLPGSANASGSGKVRVSNGKETLMIDQSDLQDAMNDGYKQVP